MKVCILGAGAIGGLIGVQLAAAGQAEVSVVARGATLEALRTKGWRLKTAGRLVQVVVRAESDAAALGPQDIVFIAVKAPALAAVAAHIAPLLAPHTLVVPAMNGVPWWLVQTVPALAGRPLASVDPAGAIAAAIPLAQVIGCVVHASASVPEPAVVEHGFGSGLIVGEPRGGVTGRVGALARLLTEAGFDARVSSHVLQDLWYKLWGNLTMNPVSALSGATTDRILADPLVRRFCSAAMAEAAAVGAALGCPIAQSPDDRHAVTHKLGAFKTSMLQDVQAGRPIELDAIVGAVHEIAQRLQLPSPHIDALLGLTRLFAQTRGLYPDAA